jgi:predicted dehydrogenase
LKKIRIGLVGCGHMGRFHAAKLSDLDGIEFAGCYDIERNKADAISKEYRVRHFHAMDDMFEAMDAVSIAVPTVHHFEVAAWFLEHGIAVLLEKPIAGDLESAQKLVEISETRKVVFQIGHSERYNPAFLAVQPGIADPKFIETHRLAPFKGRGVDVPVIFDLMVHDLDLIMALTGCTPDKIDAAGVAVITDTVDIANARLTFPNGCVANITASRISVKEMRKMRIFQKSGYTSVDMATREAEQFVVAGHDDDEYKKSSIFGRFSLPDGRAVVRKKVEIPAGDNLRFEIEAFIEAVRGEHPPDVSGRDGYNVLKVATEIERLCQEYVKKI